MRFSAAASLLLMTSSANALFRDISQRKESTLAQRNRQLQDPAKVQVPEEICTIDHEVAQTIDELDVDLVPLVENGEGYVQLTIKDPPYGTADEPLVIDGWCIDYERTIYASTFSMDILSAFDSEIRTDAVDKPENFPILAWLLNNVFVGETWPGTGDCPGGVIGVPEMQGAVWKIIDDEDGAGTEFALGRVECISEGIAAMAFMMGGEYEPDCKNPDEIIPLLFIVDKDENGEILNQVIVGEAPISAIPGLCTCVPDDRNETDPPTVKTTAPTSGPTTSPTESPVATPGPTTSPTESPVATPGPTTSPTESPVATPSPTTSPTESPVEPPTPEAPTPAAPTPEAPTPAAPTPEAPTPEAPTPAAPTPDAPTPAAPTPEAPTPEAPTPVSPPTPDAPTPTPPPSPPKATGDPHFRTWSGDRFDYHGECDLVLVKHPTFDNNKGLRLHIRTTRKQYYSYISQIALKIGYDTLEFNNDVNNYLINGTKIEKPLQGEKDETMFAGYVVRRDKRAISVRLDDTNKARIDFYQRRNGFPAVVLDGGSTNVFEGCSGLLGEFGTGNMVARDGETIMKLDDDEITATAFALEWQVTQFEPMLFSTARYPQHPVQCLPPKKRLGSRLGLSHMKKKAEEVCADWGDEDREDCIFDVIATRDFSVAAEGEVETRDVLVASDGNVMAQ